jgi:hypothetical protein
LHFTAITIKKIKYNEKVRMRMRMRVRMRMRMRVRVRVRMRVMEQTIIRLNTREELTPLTLFQDEITQVYNVEWIVIGVFMDFGTNQFFNVKAVSDVLDIVEGDWWGFRDAKQATHTREGERQTKTQCHSFTQQEQETAVEENAR